MGKVINMFERRKEKRETELTQKVVEGWLANQEAIEAAADAHEERMRKERAIANEKVKRAYRIRGKE